MSQPRDPASPSPDPSELASLRATVARLDAEVTELREELEASQGAVPARRPHPPNAGSLGALAGSGPVAPRGQHDRRRVGLMIRALLLALGIGVGMLYFMEARRPSAADVEEATARARANRARPDGPPSDAPAPPAAPDPRATPPAGAPVPP